MDKKKKLPFKIYFCTNPNFEEKLQENEALIWPDSDKWNDFKYKVHCKFKANNKNDELITGDILVAQLNFDEETTKHTGRGLGNSFNRKIFGQSTKILSSDVGKFFTLLPTMQAYRNLVSKFGIVSAREFLESSMDMVRAQEINLKSDWFVQAKRTDVFRLAFMRNSESFFAFHNAGSILNGLDQEDIGKISSSLDLRFKLNGFNNDHVVKFRFSAEGLIPKRINVLIGKNGLGKSQALKHIVLSLLQRKGFEESFIDPDLQGRPMISRVLALGTPGETNNTFPSDMLKDPRVHYKRLNLTRNGRSQSSRGIGSSLLQLIRSEESIGNISRWQIFLNALEACLPINDLVIQVIAPSSDQLTKIYIPILDIQNGKSEQEKLLLWGAVDDIAEPRLTKGNKHYSLSSGQLSFFKAALMSCLHIENGSLVLIDEPETHLHPNLISNFIELLDIILEKTGSFAILATHSVYFVREVSRSQVHVFKEGDENTVSIVSPRLKTFGCEVGAISHFVFDDEIESRLSEKIISHAKNSQLNFNDIFENYSDELSTETLMQLKRKLGESAF